MTLSRIRGRTALIGGSLLMIIGQTVVTGPVAAAGPWAPTLALATLSPSSLATRALGVGDLSAAGSDVAAAWIERDTTSVDKAWVRESVDSGTTWQPAVRLAANPLAWAGGVSLASDAAAGRHYAVWQEFDATGGNGRIFMAEKPFGTGAWTTPIQVSDNTGTTHARDPSIVVTPAYYFVTYVLSSSSANTSARLRVFDRTTGAWKPSTFVATLFNAGDSVIRLAATTSRVALVWSTSSGVVLLRRGTIASGPSPAITWATVNLGNGYYPFITLSGARGVVGWTKVGGAFIRRTTTSGATWSAATKVLSASSIQGYDMFDAAMSGLRVTLTGRLRDGVSMASVQTTSANGGITWVKTQAAAPSTYFPYDDRQVAYMTKPASGGTVVVAEAWTQQNVAGDPNKILFRRHT